MGLNKIYIAFFILTCFACKKEKEEEVDLKYEYAPVMIGHYVIYNVTEIVHDDAVGTHDTTTYKLKEKLESVYTDDKGRPSVRIERSMYSPSTGVWSVTDVWHSTRTSTTYEKTEEDEPFIRLTFPVKEGNKWNGNSLNQIGEWDYEYTDEGVARSFGGLNFAETARVKHIDEFNFVQRYYSYEIYAKNVGLVAKYYKYLNITGFDSTNAITGNELYMTVESYGVE